LEKDPYKITREFIKTPPQSFMQRIKFLGPGMILSASIVGSGELIATTTLGAQAGFVTFWVIIISCLVKVAVQIEFAKHTILTGETPMTAFNELPGWKPGGVSWSVWSVFLFMLIKLLQVGGIVGGVAILVNMVVPSLSITVAAFMVAALVSLLIFKGYYRFIEKVSIWMIAAFTIFAFMSLYFLKFTPYELTLDAFLSGLTFRLPPEAVAVAIGAFGITGVGGDEIIFYNYWCIEKGYAAYAGPAHSDEGWEMRAKGWIRTMKLDAIVAMVIYTLVTAAFYLLGAAVLNAMGEVPEGYAMLETLSSIFTASMGPEMYWVFMAGSFFILFSTLFASLAAWVRMFTDIFGKFGWIDFNSVKERKMALAISAWAIPFLWALLFVFIKMPVLMVLTGGIVGSFILFLVVGIIVRIRYKRVLPGFVPGVVYDVVLWVSILSIAFIGGYSLIQLFV